MEEVARVGGGHWGGGGGDSWHRDDGKERVRVKRQRLLVLWSWWAP